MATTAPAGLLTPGSLSAANRVGGNSLATDGRSLDALRSSAAKDPKSAAREAARQFESLFTSELLKSMRASSDAAGLMDNEGTKLGQQMLDSQLSTQLAGRPGGLAEVIARQLERQMGVANGTAAAANGSAATTASAGSTVASASSWGRRATGRVDALQDPTRPDPAAQTSARGALTGDAADFVQQHAKAAKTAEGSTGIPASFMLAQAALETGWGKKTIVGADGKDSHNLFGIKAGNGWTGRTVDVTTTEYVGGQPLRMVQKFRAYANEAESFADYAQLMKTSPRYADAVASGGNAQAFAANLQKAGYATDPAYADKLGRVINTTLRLQRSQA